MENPKAGDTPTLCGGLVEICGSGKVIEVCDDEFELD